MSSKKSWKIGTLEYSLVGLIMLGIWLVGGDFPWQLKERAVVPSATILLKQTIGVSDFVYGLIVVSFPAFTNIFLIPIVSYLSDRHRGKWGRRIPYMLFTLPFILLGLYGLGFTPMLGELLHKANPDISIAHSMLIFFCISWIFLDFGTSLSGFLFNALANDVIPREVLGRFFSLFRMVSLGAGVLYNSLIIDLVKEHNLAVFLGVGTIYGIGIFILCAKVKEGEYPPVEEVDKTVEKESTITKVMGAVGTYFRQSFSLSYYRWCILAITFSFLCLAPINYFSIQYADFVGMTMKDYGKLLVITYAFSFSLSFFYGYFADKFHPIRCGIVAFFLYAVVMLSGWLFAKDVKMFSIFFVLHGILSGACITLTAALPARILPQQLFAQFNSAIALLGAVLAMILTPLVGLTIDLLHKQYIHVFLMNTILSLITVVFFIMVYVNFMKLGGDKTYQAPLPK